MKRGSCRVLGEFEYFLFSSVLMGCCWETGKGRGKGEVVGELRAEELKRSTNLPSSIQGLRNPHSRKRKSVIFSPTLHNPSPPSPFNNNLPTYPPTSPPNKQKVTYSITHYPLPLVLHTPTKILFIYFSYKKSRYPRNHLFAKLLDDRNSQTHSGIYNGCKSTLVVDLFFGWRSWRFGV